MTIWFTSDTHFNHANIIQYSNRPFTDLEDMTESLISSWNAVVKPGDTIYHLGDFALSWGKKHAPVVDAILARLNGQKFLICGNHDRKEVKENPRWCAVRDYHEIKVDLGGVHKQRIVMFHYAMRTWNQVHRGSWLLHGHSHGNLSDIGGKTMDVGVDVQDYCPVSIDEIKAFMDAREIVACDHHIPDEEPIPDLSATAMECLLGVKFKFWTCPTCESPTIKWNGNKAWCVTCGRSNDDTVCVCGEPSITNGHGKYIGCCQTCLPF